MSRPSTGHSFTQVSTVLRASMNRSAGLGIAPPAAFMGAWLDAAAVIIPSVDTQPVDPGQVFSPPGSPRVGYRSFPDAIASDHPMLPEAVAGSARGMLVLDHHGRWHIHGASPSADEILSGWSNTGTTRGHHASCDTAVAGPPFPKWRAPDQRTHRAGVVRCLEEIAAGEIYQCCLSTRLEGTLTASPLETFLHIAQRSPAARSAFLTGSWGSVLSFSPEDYLVRSGSAVSSSPIKGTIPASSDPALLRSSHKDVAENIMIVDLVRHDLGTVADIGSVEVTELLAIRPAPGVHHLVSTVRARTGVGHDELVAATFPPASVTGTPKLRARQLIGRWEHRSRGVHCGAIGIASGELFESSVAIRTLEVAPDGRVALGVGGGITADSNPHDEWVECLHKAAFSWGGGPPPFATECD